ncbi:hypothetical protein [Nonomuraea cavernae]
MDTDGFWELVERSALETDTRQAWNSRLSITCLARSCEPGIM